MFIYEWNNIPKYLTLWSSLFILFLAYSSIAHMKIVFTTVARNPGYTCTYIVIRPESTILPRSLFAVSELIEIGARSGIWSWNIIINRSVALIWHLFSSDIYFQTLYGGDCYYTLTRGGGLCTEWKSDKVQVVVRVSITSHDLLQHIARSHLPQLR